MGAKRKISLPTKRVPAKKTTRELVAQMPSGYGQFLEDLKARIQNARVKAALAASIGNSFCSTGTSAAEYCSGKSPKVGAPGWSTDWRKTCAAHSQT